MLAENLVARLERKAWPMPPLFSWLQREGGVADDEMFRVFNCGIGMVLVVAAADAERAAGVLEREGETVWRIGVVEQRRGDEPQTIVE
jgi:phosphoribosylformylglycinamidine cyclo-ligase